MILNKRFNSFSQEVTRSKISKPDIYSGAEKMQFNNRHPIFKALMKLEFEEVIRNYQKRMNPK
jgi:hypothetical protein